MQNTNLFKVLFFEAGNEKQLRHLYSICAKKFFQSQNPYIELYVLYECTTCESMKDDEEIVSEEEVYKTKIDLEQYIKINIIYTLMN